MEKTPRSAFARKLASLTNEYVIGDKSAPYSILNHCLKVSKKVGNSIKRIIFPDDHLVEKPEAISSSIN